MLRQYGGRVLLFNTNSQATKDALQTARETNNGYILVSEDIHLDTLEAVFDLDNDHWDFPYTPETQAPHLVSSQGLDDASYLLHYYSKVEHQQTVSFDDLPILHRQTVMDIGDHYLKHLRYPGGPPEDARAGTTASAERSSAVRVEAIQQVVSEVVENAKVQKQRIAAKAMPKDQPVPPQPASDTRPVKGPPKSVLEQRAKEAEEKAKVKPPPKKLLEQLQKRPSADTPAKASQETAETTTDTTVKLEPRQPKHPPPPKRPADKTAETASARVPHPRRSNKKKHLQLHSASQGKPKQNANTTTSNSTCTYKTSTFSTIESRSNATTRCS